MEICDVSKELEWTWLDREGAAYLRSHHIHIPLFVVTKYDDRVKWNPIWSLCKAEKAMPAMDNLYVLINDTFEKFKAVALLKYRLDGNNYCGSCPLKDGCKHKE